MPSHVMSLVVRPPGSSPHGTIHQQVPPDTTWVRTTGKQTGAGQKLLVRRQRRQRLQVVLQLLSRKQSPRSPQPPDHTGNEGPRAMQQDELYMSEGAQRTWVMLRPETKPCATIGGSLVRTPSWKSGGWNGTEYFKGTVSWSSQPWHWPRRRHATPQCGLGSPVRSTGWGSWTLVTSATRSGAIKTPELCSWATAQTRSRRWPFTGISRTSWGRTALPTSAGAQPQEGPSGASALLSSRPSAWQSRRV
mmetsp:Transcript_46583/g.83330  ORF Transcript_46583/g.83330 Transcript_46583/m.83330 type:complete len:248 (-) Transcript_46583:3211-3954(-)